MTGMEGRDWRGRRQSEAERVLRAYRIRDARNIGHRYALTSIANLMAVQERERIFLIQIGRRSWTAADLNFLDVGCGSGGELARLIAAGADPRRLHGIDLRNDAIIAARARLPLCDLVTGDASELPYATASMDVILQMTMLSSILDEEVRQRVVDEMLRVCRPSGLIVSYDFITNPTSRDTRGLRRDDIRRLFAECEIEIHRVTLAPPIARRVAPRSRRLAALLGAIPLLRTHLLAFVTPPATEAAGPSEEHQS